MAILGVNSLDYESDPIQIPFTNFTGILMSGNSESPTEWSFGYSDLSNDGVVGYFAYSGYESLDDLVAGLGNFIATVGPQWVAVGDPTTYPPPEHYGNVMAPICVDITRVTGWSDGGHGIVFGGVFGDLYTAYTSTLGYSPWDNYDDANTALTALQTLYNDGYYTFDGS